MSIRKFNKFVKGEHKERDRESVGKHGRKLDMKKQ